MPRRARRTPARSGRSSPTPAGGGFSCFLASANDLKASQHLVEKIQGVVLDAVPQPALLPALGGELDAMAGVGLEDLLHAPRQRLVVEADGDLVVRFQRAVVEVARAH